VEAVAGETAQGTVEDLPAPGVEVALGYTGHALKIKRTILLDNAYAESQCSKRKKNILSLKEPVMPSRRHLAPLLLVPLLAAILLWLFAWPAARLAPRGLDVGLIGPNSAVVAIENRLTAKAGPDAFDLHRYADQRTARLAIEHRDIYGALVVGRRGKTLLTASAASPAVSNLLQQMLAAPGTQGAAPVKIVDVVPLPPADPRGGALSATLLPLLVTSTVGAGISSRVTRSLLQRVGVSVGSAMLCGLAAVGIMQGWLGLLDGNWAANAGVLALTSFAVASVVAGLTALGRTAGLTGGAVLMVLLGNAYSGNASAPELLPRGVAWIGRLLPPGAGAQALRGVAFFDGSSITLELFVLGAWSLIGVVLITAGTLRARAHSHGVHARSKHAWVGVATAVSDGSGPVRASEGKGASASTATEDAHADSVQVVRPIDSFASGTGANVAPNASEALGFEVTVVARIDAQHTVSAASAFRATASG
jgi:hypothetical protein